jgi:ribokinase
LPVQPLDVAVVGAANVDLVVRVPQLPTAGQTVFSPPLAVLPGGKGLNQAVAVAKYGGTAALVARVGGDDWGQFLTDMLTGAGVNVAGLARSLASATAAAIVQVPPDGDSAVIVARDASALPTTADLVAAKALLTHATVTVIQLGLPGDVVELATNLAEGEVIGTLAPVTPLPGSVLTRLNTVMVNAAEAATMLGTTAHNVLTDPGAAAQALLTLGPAAAVITLGPRGAVYANGQEAGHVPAMIVTAADTTGAGDAALGAFALARARRHPVPDAVVAAVAAGTAAVQQHGATMVERP